MKRSRLAVEFFGNTLATSAALASRVARINTEMAVAPVTRLMAIVTIAARAQLASTAMAVEAMTQDGARSPRLRLRLRQESQEVEHCLRSRLWNRFPRYFAWCS